MTTKRIRSEHELELDQQEEKRMRRLPSFSTVIKEAVMAKYLQNLGLVLEPLIRRVVKDEVERGIIKGSRLLQRSPHMQLEAPESSGLQLIFKKPLLLPIFTGSTIEDAEKNLIQVILVDSRNGESVTPASPIRVEIVVIDGDFPSGNHDNWTSVDFNKHIVKERTGRRPLITGDVVLTLREPTATISDLTFTDNSSWIRSRHFRIGARVSPDSYNGPMIREALTERFKVKDHRGELYRKHYPPSLVDKVWRLDKIGKDGIFHKKLSAKNINTVQDFLKLESADSDDLRRILGVGMSDRMWEGTISHARTCPIDTERLFIYRGELCSILLNQICEVQSIMINGDIYELNKLNRSLKAYVQQLVREAYNKWDTLEEANEFFGGNTVNQNELMMHVANGSSSTSSCPYNQDITPSQYQTSRYGEEGVHPHDMLTRNISSSYCHESETSKVQYW